MPEQSSFSMKILNHSQQISLEQVRKQISVVLQPTQFYKTLKVEELLQLFKAYYKSPIDIETIIADFKLEPHRKKYFDKLSGGWKQIVSLAIAFLSQPKLLILDEPTTGLDPHMRNILWTYITDYNKRTGGTVILTTHNMDEIEMYCDKVMLIIMASMKSSIRQKVFWHLAINQLMNFILRKYPYKGEKIC